MVCEAFPLKDNQFGTQFLDDLNSVLGLLSVLACLVVILSYIRSKDRFVCCA
jgi:hypothetical protein